MNNIIIIYGPTAVGKTTLGIYLAKMLDTEIISADSRQIYKFMSIGTNKPTPEELNQTKIHLIDFLDPTQKFSAMEFVNQTDKLVKKLWNKNRTPIILGGTGFYIDAFLNGLSVSVGINKNIRDYYKGINSVESKEYKKMLYKLMYLDKEYALKEIKNIRRLIRYMEIYYLTGKTYYQQNDVNPIRNDFYKNTNVYFFFLNMDRDKLYKKINQRVDKMIETGLLNEIESLLNRGYSFNDPGLNSVGYREYESYFNNNSDLNIAIEKHKQNTRHFAKRQITYLNKIN